MFTMYTTSVIILLKGGVNMTKEEAISRLKEGEPFSELYEPDWEEAKNIAIKALEQKPDLSKIRAEIKKLYRDRPNSYNHPQRTEFYSGVLAIIDKYSKSESEDNV